MPKIPNPPKSSRTKIHVVQKRREQINVANGECTRLAASLGMIDMQMSKLEVDKAKLEAEKLKLDNDKVKLRRQLKASFERRSMVLESAALDHDIDLKNDPWTFDMAEGAFVYGKAQPNLVAVPLSESPPETPDMEVEVPSAGEPLPQAEAPVVVPRGSGSLDD